MTLSPGFCTGCRLLVTPRTRLLRSQTSCHPQNQVLAHFFPHAVLDPSSHGTHVTADRIKVKRNGIYREGTIDARGIDSKITGGHYTHQSLMTLVDDKMVDSESTQETAINRVKRSDSLFVEPNKNIEIIVGTRWPGMFYQWLIEDSGITDEYWTLILGCYKDSRWIDFMHALGREVSDQDMDRFGGLLVSRSLTGRQGPCLARALQRGDA